jgi:hypothetical protein
MEDSSFSMSILKGKTQRGKRKDEIELERRLNRSPARDTVKSFVIDKKDKKN